MARMIPDYEVHQVFDVHSSRAEAEVYRALKNQLPDEITVLYSVPWVTKNSQGDVRDGETDFVIIDPNNGIAILEVKGGPIEVSSGGLWSTRGKDGKIVPITNPFRQGVTAKNVIKREVGIIPGVNTKEMIFAHGVALPDINGNPGHLGPDAPRDIVLTGDGLDSVSTYVSDLFDYWSRGETMPLDSTKIEMIVQRNFPRVVLAPSLAVEARDADQRIIELTNQQRSYLGLLRGKKRICIEGPAGTGKTVLAIEKALQLARENVETLLVCYNKPLSERLQDRAKRENLQHLTVLTFHDLCIRIATEAGADARYKSGFSQDEYFNTILPDLLLTSIEKLPERRFDAIVVDEGQDLEPLWWLHLGSLLKSEEEGWFWIFRDTAQNLYNREQNLPHDMESYPLDQNVRNTKTIHEAAAPYASGDPGYSMGPVGPEVRYELATTKGAVRTVVKKLLHELITDGGILSKDVVVLTGKSVKNSSLAGYGRLGAFDLKPLGGDGAGVEVESIWRFKGLERPVVIITDLLPDARNALRYVAMTRARNILIMVGASAS